MFFFFYIFYFLFILFYIIIIIVIIRYLRNNKFESYPCDTVIENDFQDCHINLENFMCTVIPILAIIIIGFAMVMIKKFGNANENNKETQNNDDQTDELTVKVEDSN